MIQNTSRLSSSTAYQAQKNINYITRNQFLDFAKKEGIDGEEIFKTLDTNRDGKLSQIEFKESLQKLKEQSPMASVNEEWEFPGHIDVFA